MDYHFLFFPIVMKHKHNDIDQIFFCAVFDVSQIQMYALDMRPGRTTATEDAAGVPMLVQFFQPPTLGLIQY